MDELDVEAIKQRAHVRDTGPKVLPALAWRVARSAGYRRRSSQP